MERSKLYIIKPQKENEIFSVHKNTCNSQYKSNLPILSTLYGKYKKNPCANINKQKQKISLTLSKPTTLSRNLDKKQIFFGQSKIEHIPYPSFSSDRKCIKLSKNNNY